MTDDPIPDKVRAQVLRETAQRCWRVWVRNILTDAERIGSHAILGDGSTS